MIKKYKNILKILILILLPVFLLAQEEKPEVGIQEHLGEYLPMDLTFQDVNGKTVRFGDLVDKPVLLTFVYYGCPGICNPLLAEVVDIVNHIELEPGEDFKLITLSFNHREDSAKARTWANRHLGLIKRKFDEHDWEFLTGDSLSIDKMTDAAGFYFKEEGVDFIHAGTIMAISPEGKISRYLIGTSFNKFDVQMALIDAKSGKTNPTIAKLLQFCYSYDPDGRAYTLNITRIVGTVMLAFVGLFFAVLVVAKKKKKGE
ncbi:MAG: SCO family protein [Rhodothermaceae bacterium]